VHETVIFPETLAACERRGRGLHIFTEFDPSRCVHVDIDMQNGFVEPDGIVSVPAARGVINNINRISRAVRASGGSNIFTRWLVQDPNTAVWPGLYEQNLQIDSLREAFSHGSIQFELSDKLDLVVEDRVIDKTRFSAFIPGSSDLEDILREAGAEILIVTGTVTNVCCESTVRDAMQMGYKVIVAYDAMAAFTDEIHNRAINAMAGLFADVVDTDQLLQSLENNVLRPAASAQLIDRD